MRHNITQTEAPARIRSRLPFQASALSGVEGSTGTGDLPPDVAERYELDDRSPGVLYTVLSYETPIAWYVDGTWVVVRNRFSLTTTNHQTIVRSALRGFGPSWRGGYEHDEDGNYTYVEHPDKPHDLYSTGEVVEVGEYERAVPVDHYGRREGW